MVWIHTDSSITENRFCKIFTVVEISVKQTVSKAPKKINFKIYAFTTKKAVCVSVVQWHRMNLIHAGLADIKAEN